MFETKRIAMTAVRFLGAGALAAMALAASGCASIREHRGYIVDQTLTSSIQPGIDNKQSVQGTLGHPSFESQFGQPTWYYVSSQTGRKPFVNARITDHQVLAVQFDAAGNVANVERTGIDKVVYLSPDGDATPTVGRERGFFEDLFGNIGAVGAPGAGAPGGGNTGP
jgi:outer membrane protein assembly factor BamE (lipoprotein component of BamABCDE complex)